MFRFVVLSFAFLLTFSASAASPEILVGRSEPAPAPQQRSEPAVASDGDGFFVVWADERSGTGAVLGTRITRDGRILDPFGLRISSPTLYVQEPRVAWDGEAYLVVWAQSETNFYERDLYAARIAPDGAMEMRPRLVVEDAFTDGSYLASNGTVSVIAYVDSIANGRIVVLDQEGNTTHDEVIASDAEYKRDFAIAAGTSRFVVAWAENEGFDPDSDVVKAVTVTASGHVIGTPAKIQNGDLPAIATDGTYFQVVSRTSNSWIDQHLRTRRFDGNLQPAGDEHMLLESRQFDHTNVLWLGGNRYEVLFTSAITPGNSEIVSIDLDNGTPR